MKSNRRVFIASSHEEGREIIYKSKLEPYNFLNDRILSTNNPNRGVQGMILDPDQVYLLGDWHHGKYWWETWNLLLCRFRVPGKQDLTKMHYIEG